MENKASTMPAKILGQKSGLTGKSNFNDAQMARPGYKFSREEQFGFNVNNDIAAARTIALSVGRNNTAAALTTAGLSVNQKLADGTLETNLVVTASEGEKTCDHFMSYAEVRRFYVTGIRITSDVTSQFAKTIKIASTTPAGLGKVSTLQVSKWKSPNQNSSTEIERNLLANGEAFWIGPDTAVVMDFAASSDVDVILTGYYEYPSN